MNILAIESASTICGVAIFLKSKLVELDEIDQPRIHGNRLPVLIHDILNNHSITINQLDGIAISSGPGSYTGLRIGMSLARGLAASGGIPIIPVPTLFSMNVHIQKKGIYWIMLHSHKNLVYAQRYHSGEPYSEVVFVEYNADEHESVYGYNLENLCEDYKSIPPSAQSVGELALQNYDKWVEEDLNQVSLNYITHFNLGKVKKA